MKREKTTLNQKIEVMQKHSDTLQTTLEKNQDSWATNMSETLQQEYEKSVQYKKETEDE